MGRCKDCKEIITYFKEAKRMCKSIIGNCEGQCPLARKFDTGELGCEVSLFNPDGDEKKINEVLYKIYAVQKWSDEHPEEEEGC